MNNPQKLKTIKLIHTLIWFFMVSVIFYVLYSGITDHVNIFTWLAIAIILLEGIVLAVFKMSCPLTILARRYSASTRDNFDIYLPEPIARYNKHIFTTIFILGLFTVLYRII